MGEHDQKQQLSLVLLLVSIFAAAPAAGAELDSSGTCFSPDRRIQYRIETDAAGIPRCAVTYAGEEILAPSRLGLRYAMRPGMDEGGGK